MAKRSVIIEIEDVGGSFARLIKQAPRECRAFLSQAVSSTTFAVSQRMQATVPVDSGSLKADLEARLPKRNGLHGQAGVWEPESASVALFNEYRPNMQPFMRPAAYAEAEEFKKRAMRALKSMEASLSIGAD